MDEQDAFARLLDALRPWLEQVMFVGGWAHRLHRLQPTARRLAYKPVITKDADVAFATSAPLKGNIAEALKSAGFKKVMSGDDTPPVTEYQLGDGDQGFYAEFLTPLLGSEVKRGKRDVTVAKAGITAQKLRYLDLLLIKPWTIRLTSKTCRCRNPQTSSFRTP